MPNGLRITVSVMMVVLVVVGVVVDFMFVVVIAVVVVVIVAVDVVVAIVVVVLVVVVVFVVVVVIVVIACYSCSSPASMRWDHGRLNTCELGRRKGDEEVANGNQDSTTAPWCAVGTARRRLLSVARGRAGACSTY